MAKSDPVDLRELLSGHRNETVHWESPGRRRLRRFLILTLISVALLWLGQRSLQRVVPAVQAQLFTFQVRKHRSVLMGASEESGVDPYLLAAMMCAESSGAVDARSKANALGLFQLRIGTAVERAQRLGLDDPTEEDLLSDGALNARLGADYIAWLLQRNKGNVERSLIAYNTGPTRLHRMIEAAGGWEAWRAERERAGNSDLLAFARKVMMLRDRFAQKKLLE